MSLSPQASSGSIPNHPSTCLHNNRGKYQKETEKGPEKTGSRQSPGSQGTLLLRGIVYDCGGPVCNKLIWFEEKITSVKKSKLKEACTVVIGNRAALSRRKYSNPTAYA